MSIEQFCWCGDCTFAEFVKRISCVIVPPGGNTDPDGDNICSVKLLGTAAWNKYCSNVFIELFVADIMTRRHPLPSPPIFFWGTKMTFNPFLSNAVNFAPLLDATLLVELFVKSSNKLPPNMGDVTDGIIDRILLPFELMLLTRSLVVDGGTTGVDGVDKSSPPSKSSRSWLFGMVSVPAIAFSDALIVGDIILMELSVPPSKSSNAFCEVELLQFRVFVGILENHL